MQTGHSNSDVAWGLTARLTPDSMRTVVHTHRSNVVEVLSESSRCCRLLQRMQVGAFVLLISGNVSNIIYFAGKAYSSPRLCQQKKSVAVAQ